MMRKLIFFTYATLLTLMLFVSCESDKKTNETVSTDEKIVLDSTSQIKDTVSIKKDSLIDSDKKRSASQTSTLVKESKITVQYSEDQLMYFDKLKSKDKNTRVFYFRAITDSYKGADGAYSEGLGNYGKSFIEDNPQEFAAFFDDKKSFNDEDLKTWSKIALLKFAIIDENIETGKGEPLVNGYCKQLIKDSQQYPDSQKQTIKKFTVYLFIGRMEGIFEAYRLVKNDRS